MRKLATASAASALLAGGAGAGEALGSTPMRLPMRECFEAADAWDLTDT